MKKEIVEAKKQELVKPVTNFGAANDITAEDILLGRISIVQANSEFVKKDDKFRAGQIVNSLTQTILAEKTKPLEMIILKSFKYWVEKEKTPGGEVFKRKFPALSIHEQDWESGVLRRYFHHAYYVILPSDPTMPLEIAFRSTELSSAKKIASFLFKLRVQGISSFGKVFAINTELRTKGTNSWFGTNVVESRDTTPEEAKAAEFWEGQLNKVNLSAQQPEEDLVTPPPGPNSDLY